MALGQTFDLARIYGAAENIKTQRKQNELVDYKLGVEKVMAETAKAAIDPQTGVYSPVMHADALNKAGYPKAGAELAQTFVDRASKMIEFADRSWSFLSEQTYPSFKAGLERLGMPPDVLPKKFDPDQIKRGKAALEKPLSEFRQLMTGPNGEESWGKTDASGAVHNMVTYKPPAPDKPGRPAKPIQAQFEDGSTGFVDPETGRKVLPGMRPVPTSRQGVKMPVGYQEDPSRPGAIMPIPGGPAEKLPGDMAGKASLIDEAARAVSDVRGMLFDDSGALRRGQAFKAQTNMPWSEGRQASQRIRVAVEAALRITSGAAVPDTEVERYTDMFTPSVMDDDQTAMQKMDSLTNFVNQARANIATGRGQPSAQAPPTTPAPSPRTTSNGLPLVSGYDDYHALPSGAQYVDRYGRTRRKR